MPETSVDTTELLKKDSNATFTTGRIVDGTLLLARHHQARLARQWVQGPNDFGKHWALLETHLRSQTKLEACRLIMWRDNGRSHLVFQERALPPDFSARRKGITLRFALDTRTKGCEEKWLDRSHLEAIRKEALEHAPSEGPVEVLLHTIDRGISEGVYSNLFIETSDGWSTPSLTTKDRQRALNGVGRQAWMGYLRSRNIRVDERDIYPDELIRADRIWLTNGLMGIAPAFLERVPSASPSCPFYSEDEWSRFWPV